MKFAPYAKTYAALIGSIATALFGIYGDGPAGKILTAVAVVCTAIATFSVTNVPDPDQGDDGALNLSPIVTVLLVIALVLLILALLGHRVIVG